MGEVLRVSIDAFHFEGAKNVAGLCTATVALRQPRRSFLGMLSQQVYGKSIKPIIFASVSQPPFTIKPSSNPESTSIPHFGLPKAPAYTSTHPRR